MDNVERTYTPTEAAEAFGFALSLLRRYAGIYESIGGSIPHDRRGGRIYSHTILEHFSRARERVKGGETVEDALKTIDLAPTNAVVDTQNSLNANEALRLLGGRFDAAIERLEAKVDALQRQLEAPPQAPTEVPQDPQHGPLVRAALWLERQANLGGGKRTPRESI